MRKIGRLRLWQWIVLFIVALPIALFLILGLLPIPSDPVLSPEKIIVGARGKAGSASSIAMDFPKMSIPDGNAVTPEKQELGRLLFFDPILSAKDDMSCA